MSNKQGIINFKDNGNAYVIINGTSHFIYTDNTNKALPGDLVELEFFLFKYRTEARVKKIINRERTKFVGIANVKKDVIYVRPLKQFGSDFLVKKSDVLIPYDSINDGDKVVVEFVEWKKSMPRAKLIERLGESLDNEVEMHSIIIEYGFDTKFPTDVIEESEKISDVVEATPDRTDMRNILTFTIDPETAKDFDDALSIEYTKAGYIIGVHIADVSHYVKENSLIDKEAIKRATSVYLVDRTIPMLPERLSNGLCSLNPHVDRYAFSVMFDISNEGKINKYWLQNSVINSNRRYSYEESLDVIEGKDDQYSKELKDLCELSIKIKKDRSKDNLEVQRKEAKFKIDENGKPLEIFFKEPTKSTQLIEEFMLLANKHIGLEFQKKGWKFIWRTHDLPDMEKLYDLERYLDMVGIQHKIRAKHIKEDLNAILNKTKDTFMHETCSTMAMKSMAKALYSTNNIGHYGLGFVTYSHFTSPIRRYPDLIAHRILKKHLEGKVYNYPSLEDRCSHCNMKEVSAQRAERDSIKYKQTEYMSQFLEQEFEGNVSFIMSNRVFVILENGIEGSFQIMYDDDNDSNSFYANGKLIKIGERVRVKVTNCDLFMKQINLRLI